MAAAGAPGRGASGLAASRLYSPAMEGTSTTGRAPGLPRAIAGALRRRAFWICLVALLVAQLALTAYFMRPRLFLDSEPLSWLDYDTHIGQVWRFMEAYGRWGESWLYDPYMYAGYHNDTVFDADNKAWEVWTYALSKAGVPRAVAFDLFVLLAHLLAPWLLFAAARMSGLDRWGALVAALFGLSFWFFDAFPRWCWWIGMIAWAWAAILAPLALAALYRFLKDGRPFHGIVGAIVLAVGHLIHPYLFVAVAVPMVALYARAFRTLSPARHAGVVGMAALTVAVNAWWIVTALRFWHYILGDAAYCFQGDLKYLLTDYLGLIGTDPLVSGAISNRTAFRTAAIACAIGALVCWRLRRDDRTMPFALALGTAFAVTYLGGYAWITKQIQPYRFVLPAIFLTAVPAAWFVVDTARSGALARLPRLARVAFGIAAFAALPALARDVLYYFPAALPSQSPYFQVMPTPFGVDRGAPIAGLGWHKQMEFRPDSHFQDLNDVTKFVREADRGEGRILVEWYVLAEHLAWRTRAQILGGFERAEAHTYANLFRRDPEGLLPRRDLRRYFEDYAVRWVIMTHEKRVERRRDLLEPVGGIPPYNDKGLPMHRVYRTKVEVSYFAENDGEVEVDFNTIRVRGTDPSRDAVLRFHFLETLACEPGCALRREPLREDPVGFIRVPAPHPADFAIVNRYGAAR